MSANHAHPPEQGVYQFKYKVEKLTCSDCAAKVEKSVAALNAVDHLHVDIISSEMTLETKSENLDHSEVIKAVKKTGFKARLLDGNNASKKTLSVFTRYRHHILSAVSAFFWAIGTALAYFEHPVAGIAAYIITILLAGSTMAGQIWTSIKNLSLDMNLLMTGAVIGAAILGEWAEGAMVILLFSVSELIESYSLEKANRAIESLMDLASDTVRIIGINGETEKDPMTVPVGSVFLVKPGERIGLDGTITTGRSSIDQSMVTGEPLPVTKSPGDGVYAGTINGEGVLTVRSTRTGAKSTVARIIELVREARSTQTRTQRFIDSFSKVYTPMIFALALLTVLIPTTFLGLGFTDWFYRGLVILLIGCPCAFIIATPVTVVSGLAAAARAGVMIKGGIGLEKAAGIKAVAFDKTGTLTVGKPKVVDVIPLNGLDAGAVLSLAAAVESKAGHVLGDAIVDFANTQGRAFPDASGVKLVPGLGATGRVHGKQVIVGSHNLFHQKELCRDEIHAKALELEDTARNLVFVGLGEQAQGIIVLADSIRDNAPDSLEKLRHTGAMAMSILSGDTKRATTAVGRQLDIDEVFAESMPEHKVEALKYMRKNYGPVAMVGDGINDAPALAASDFGIAMGAGSDQALETADAALISGNLAKLPALFNIARKTMARLKFNIALALSIKGAFFIAAIGGWATLWMAVFADTGASLLVIGSGLMLLRTRGD